MLGTQTVLRQHHEAVKPQVRRFVNDILAAFIFGGHHAFDRLLADFLQNAVGCLGKEFGHVARLRIGALARFDAVGHRRKHARHIVIGQLIGHHFMIGH